MGFGDLVSVQVQDGQHGAVARRVEELVGVPAGGQRAGLGFAIADHAAGHQIGIIEDRAMGMQQRVAEFAALVDGAGRFRRDVAGDAAGKRKLREEALHALDVLPDVGIELAVGSFEIGVRHHARAAMSGAGDVDHVEVVLLDDAVAVGVDEVQAGRGSPMAQQARLDVLRLQRLGEQRVIEQIDLADRKIVGRAPVGVDLAVVLRGKELVCEWACCRLLEAYSSMIEHRNRRQS